MSIIAKDEVGNDDTAGQDGAKKKRNRKRNKAKGLIDLMDITGQIVIPVKITFLSVLKLNWKMLMFILQVIFSN